MEHTTGKYTQYAHLEYASFPLPYDIMFLKIWC